jgi:hypothetical protein
MSKIRVLVAAAALFAASLFGPPANADYVVKDGNGTIQTIKAGVVGSAILPYMSPVDSTGTSFGTMANPFAVQFGAGVTLPAFATPPQVICISGCASSSINFGNPIGAAGTPSGFKDSLGNFQSLLGDVVNGQWVNVKAGSLSLTGTLPAFTSTPTFNLGALNGAATNANQIAVIGSVAGGTPAANSNMVGGQYNSTPITLLNTQQAALQLDANGFIKVNIAAGAAAGGTSSTFGAAFPSVGTAMGMLQSGNMVAITGTAGNLNVQCSNCSGSGVSTADQATFVPGVSIFAGGGGFYQTTVTSNPLTSGQQGMFQVTQFRALMTNLRDSAGTELATSGNPLQVTLANTGANGTALLVNGPGGVFPVTGTVTANLGTIGGVATQTTLASVLTALGSPFQAGGSIGNTSFAVTQSSAAALNATVVGTGTFAVQAAQSGAWNVTNITGTISLPTGASTAALQPSNVAPSSTTSTQTGTMGIGAVTTASPTYTSGQNNYLSLDTGGNLRVVVSGGTGGGAVFGPTAVGSANANPPVVIGGTVTGAAGQNVVGAAVKPASTAPLATDTSMVVSISPNSAGLVGTGTAGSANAQVLTVQGIAAMTPLLVSQSGTFTDRITGNAGALLDFAGQNAAGTFSSVLVGGQFNTTPTTITSGNFSPFQMDAAGNLLVNVKVGGGGGGGGAVTIASGAVASGAYASGSIASGAYASGAFASGAFAAGSIANGANVVEGTITTAHSCLVAGYTIIGCLGQIDDDIKGPIPQVTGPLNAATAVSTNALTVGGQYLSTQPTMTNTQQAGLLLSSRGELLVAPGTSGFPVTFSGNVTVVGPTASGSAASTNPVLMAGTTTGGPTSTISIPAVSSSGVLSVGLATLNAVALGSPSNYGTSPGAVAVQGVNAFITNTVPVTLTSTTITGTVAVTQSTSPWIVAGGGTAGTPGTAVLAVQGVSGGTAVPISGTVALSAGAAAIGSITNTTFAATQATAGSLNATVVGTGTFAVQATQSGTWNIGSITTLPALVAGSAIIGKVGIDQTTIGTTNGVALVAINAATALAGAGAVGTGSLRVAVGQDTTTIAGAAPGTAGAASANVVTVQGVASMTPLAGNITQVLGAAISATNGLFSNLLQGNAVLSASNPSFAAIATGGNTAAVKAASTPSPATDQSLSVTINAGSNGITPPGQATKSASLPVTMASDQYVDPCQSGAVAKSSAPINVTSATTTALVTVSGSTTVYVCGFDITIAPSATAADSAEFEYGSGTACATSPQALTGTFGAGDLTTAAPPTHVSYGGSGATIFKSAASNGVCLLSAGTTVNIQGVITYVQQ